MAYNLWHISDHDITANQLITEAHVLGDQVAATAHPCGNNEDYSVGWTS